MDSDLFYRHLRDWRRHALSVSCSSDPARYLDCDGYRSIVAMGPPALPLLLEECRRGVSFAPLGLETAIQQITGQDIPVPEPERGHLEKVRERAIQFLEDYLRTR